MAKQKLVKGKVMNIVLLVLAFIMTIIVTMTMTLAWFFDNDWASNNIAMGGRVDVYLTNGDKVTDPDTGEEVFKVTSAKNNLHFKLYDADAKAYPGQAIDVKASVYNSGESDCFVRAKFMVATNIPKDEPLDLSKLYVYLQELVNAINKNTAYDYCWIYYERDLAQKPIIFDGKYYINGADKTLTEWNEMQATEKLDGGYYYLCKKTTGNAGTTTVLKPMTTSMINTFFMNSTFILPWQLTNDSSSCDLYAAVQFDAIQTYIPIIYDPAQTDTNAVDYSADESLHGTISKAHNNRFPVDELKVDTYSLQAVFNSCEFEGFTNMQWIDEADQGKVNVQTKPPEFT